MTTQHPVLRRARPHPRTRRAALAALTALLVCSLGACKITWSWGATHGAIVEPAAARASVGIWRAPTRLLADLEHDHGIEVVQHLLCAAGKFPMVAISVRGHGVSVDVLKRRWCGYVDGRPEDLRTALREAQRHGVDECLALTLISSGRPTVNWTHKGVGCKTGALR